MAPLTAYSAIHALLSADDTLRREVIRLTPKGQPTGENDILRRFSLAPGPQDSPTYPLILWRLIGTPGGNGTRCGALGATRSRIRVWVENPGRNVGDIQAAADRIEALLSGYSSGGIFFACDSLWSDIRLGASGEYVEAGYEFIAIHRGS